MNQRRRAGAAGAVGAAITSMLIAGCGVIGEDGFADQPIEEIEDAIVADMTTVSALRMKGSVKGGSAQDSVDFAMDKEGDCVGHIRQGQGRASFMVVGGKRAFIKADTAFYKANGGGDPAVLKKVANKWVKQDPSTTTDFCSLQKFLDEFAGQFDGEAEEGKPETGEEAEMNGRDVVEFISEEDGETTRMWVGTGAEHYVMKMVSEGGDEPGTFTFSDYNKDVVAKVPAKAVSIPGQ